VYGRLPENKILSWTKILVYLVLDAIEIVLAAVALVINLLFYIKVRKTINVLKFRIVLLVKGVPGELRRDLVREYAATLEKTLRIPSIGDIIGGAWESSGKRK
jgi:hypothetical protein